MALYRLRCAASWSSADIAELLVLFKEQSVNVRRLFLVEAFNRPACSNMEIRFVVPVEPSSLFLEALQQKLTAMNCLESELVPLQEAG